jgi:hypothetical protein
MFFIGKVGYAAGLRPSRGRGEAGSDRGLFVRRTAPKATSAQEALRWWWMAPKVIGTPKISVSSVAAQGTHVTSPLMRNENIYKSQMTVMTL